MAPAHGGENTIVVIPGANSSMNAEAVESAAARIVEAAVVAAANLAVGGCC